MVLSLKKANSSVLSQRKSPHFLGSFVCTDTLVRVPLPLCSVVESLILLTPKCNQPTVHLATVAREKVKM